MLPKYPRDVVYSWLSVKLPVLCVDISSSLEFGALHEGSDVLFGHFSLTPVSHDEAERAKYTSSALLTKPINAEIRRYSR